MQLFSNKFTRGLLSLLRDLAIDAKYHGSNRYCPTCGKHSRAFLPAGLIPRKDASCPFCGALERHRLLCLFLQKNPSMLEGRPRTLHVAPEPCLEPIFRSRLGERYLTADLFNPKAMERMDICDIHHVEESFGAIYCSHVLEHVPDDRRAIREFFRILKGDGWAILNVPIMRDSTYEDPSIVDPKEREKAFGQVDHVRVYGSDYIDRLREAGFFVKVIKVSDLANKEQAEKMGLTQASGEIFFCVKQPRDHQTYLKT